MATRVVVIWVLMLTAFWASVFAFFSQYYSGGDLEKQHIASLQERLRHHEREIAKLQLRFNEYKDALVLAGLKIDEKTSWTDPKRSIASVMADPEFKAIPKMDTSLSELDKAKRVFSAGDFQRAQSLLSGFMDKYPDHPNLPEVAYLLSECYFSMGQYEASAKMIDLVVTHFPETEYGGYVLVRLGKLFEEQERIQEAKDVYELVTRNYPKSNAAFLAKQNIKDLNL